MRPTSARNLRCILVSTLLAGATGCANPRYRITRVISILPEPGPDVGIAEVHEALEAYARGRWRSGRIARMEEAAPSPISDRTSALIRSMAAAEQNPQWPSVYPEGLADEIGPGWLSQGVPIVEGPFKVDLWLSLLFDAEDRYRGYWAFSASQPQIPLRGAHELFREEWGHEKARGGGRGRSEQVSGEGDRQERIMLPHR